MGWGSFLGEFAKGFANGYIEERGVKGTLEDLGSVASSVKEFFSNNNDEDGPDFWAIYNQYMEEEDYNSAIEFVEEYYSNQGLAQDYILLYDRKCSIGDEI